MEWRALPEEKQHQQALLLTLFKWLAIIGPFSVFKYGRAYHRFPAWPTFAIAITVLVGLLGLIPLYPRVRRGELRVATRFLLALFVVFELVFLLSADDSVKVAGTLGLPALVLLAIALEPPPVAFAWAGVLVAASIAGVAVPSLVHVPRIVLGEGQEMQFKLIVIPIFLLLALLGRSTTRHLRAALSSSEEARSGLEASNAQLEQQRAELQQAEAHLSTLASNLDRTNRELDGFAHAVSHDLLAPLTALEGDSRALGEQAAAALDEAGREYVQGIVESSRHMNGLVNGLLAYSRLAQPRTEVEPVDVGALVERVATALHLRSRAELALPAEPLMVRANGLRLEQIFSNLLDNAVKFQAPGVRPVVAVEWADGGEAWELSVRDNGIGIEPRHFEKIFGIFQRLHLQGEYEGTGIGLAIVKKAVEEHGGKVWVESAPGQGSTFRFTLPKPAEAGAPKPSGEGAGSPAPLQLPPAPEPARARSSDPELSPEGRRLQRELVSMAFKFSLAASPVFLGIRLTALMRPHTWVALVSVLVAGTLLGVSAWGSWYIRRGEATLPGRTLLVTAMAISAQNILRSEDVVLQSSTAGMVTILLFATAIERPSLALRWAWVASALYAVALALRSALPMPSLALGPTAAEVNRYVPTFVLLVYALFARSSIQQLRRALSRSRATHRDLEEARARLERQRAELLAARAHLSALTSDLARSNRELQSFAYIASHDLRAPLRALTNYSRFLQEDCAQQLDAAGRARVQHIADNARHMDLLVSALLEYSRIGRVPIELEWVGLGELLDHVAGSLRGAADVQLPADLPAIWGRRLRLQQIFSHLLENAVKHARGGVRPAIAVEWADRGGEWELSVRDNGAGIEPQDRERIFGLFQRLRPQGPRDGTGMGLAIVKKAVEEHGGKVWVESSPGQGSVFRFTVPKPAAAPPAGQRQALRANA